MYRVQFGVVVCVVFAVSGSCAKSERASKPGVSTERLLPDTSFVPLGRGLDRAKGTAVNSCFVREAPHVVPEHQWKASGFTAYTSKEVDSKLRTAVEVGLKVDSIESKLGERAGEAVGDSGESPYFVALAQFRARTEWAGELRGESSSCRLVRPSGTLEDFVNICGDVDLISKTYGGHVVLAWRRDPSRPAVDSLMAEMLGAATVGSTFDPLANLEALFNQGLGAEQLVLESFGMPVQAPTTTLPSGLTVISVRDALIYFKDVAGTNSQLFQRTVDHTTRQYTHEEVAMCLGQAPAVSREDWVCIQNTLSALVELRDGVGESAFQRNQYEQHKLALQELVPDGRVVFNTVPQRRCATDDDGDPNLEASGPCQVKLLEQFIAFYEGCTTNSATRVMACRNELDQVSSCADFESKGCTLPKLTLSNGQSVSCDENGINAALNDVVGYSVRPPFTPQTSAAPVVSVFEFNDSNQGLIPGVTTATHFCGLSGIRGGLHEASFGVAPNSSGEWRATVNTAVGGYDKRVSLEVSCVEWSAFTRHSGGRAEWGSSHFIWTGTTGFTNGFIDEAGVYTLLHMQHYLSEPQTSYWLEELRRDSISFFADEAFPFAASGATVGVAMIEGGTPSSGAAPAGTIAVPSNRLRFYGAFAQIDYATRDTTTSAVALSDSDVFCFVTGVSGHFYSASDSIHVDRSDGRITLVSTTPINKDRNPGAQVQCVRFDSL